MDVRRTAIDLAPVAALAVLAVVVAALAVQAPRSSGAGGLRCDGKAGDDHRGQVRRARSTAPTIASTAPTAMT